jgi:hypothetical protein
LDYDFLRFVRLPVSQPNDADVNIDMRSTFALMSLALTACSGSAGSQPPRAAGSNSPAPVPAPTATAGRPSPSAKQPLHGLVSMGATGFVTESGGIPDNGMEEINAHPNVYAGAVINVTWSQLEPAQGTFDDSAIDAALATIAQYDAAHPAAPVSAKLRVFAGPHVPAWVMSVAGGPITITGTNGPEQIAAFWTSGYDLAWRALQQHLASVYDASSSIGEVAVSSCSSLTAEPFVIALDPASLTAMRAYGFDDTALMACLNGAASDYSSWTATPLDFTFNEFRLSDGSSLVADPSFTTSVMQSFRSAIGSRAVIANHGLQSPLASGAVPVYDEIAALGPAIEFQTISPTVDWTTAFALGLTYHPTEVEIWQTTAAGGPANLSLAQLQEFAAELR